MAGYDSFYKAPKHPKRYADRLDSVKDRIAKVVAKGQQLDKGGNPNGQYELFDWCVKEIEKLRYANGILKEQLALLFSDEDDPSPPSTL